MRAELAIATAAILREPSAAAGRRASSSSHETGNLPGELLPDGVDEPHGPVADYELRWSFVL